jgi:hypothetical protein
MPIVCGILREGGLAGKRRDVLRPPLALARLTESSGGQRLYEFRRAWRDGSTAQLLELLQRSAALVPPPRRLLLAYHGLLAPHARLAIDDCPAADVGRRAG